MLTKSDLVKITGKGEGRFQEERKRDLYLLLENLTLQEEATIKLIIECLYDIGMINVINRKIQRPSLNRIAKFFINTPKPIAKILAWRWVKKNLPQQLANWLYRKVS